MYSLLHRLVFGDDRGDDALGVAEKGEAPATVATKSKDVIPEMTGAEYYGKLAFCTIGLQISYLTWGVLQVCFSFAQFYRHTRTQLLHAIG